MDKALEAAAALEGLRQQHGRQLTALRQEQQQQLEGMQQQAAAQEAQHKQVRLLNNWRVTKMLAGWSPASGQSYSSRYWL
jgi:hypothetical protein